MIKERAIEERLQEIIKNSDGIMKEVAEFALDMGNPITALEDVTHFGCVSGIVDKLICFKDTHNFFDEHYDEIEDLREKYEYSPPYGEDLKNNLAWFAFEAKASELLDMLYDEFGDFKDDELE